MSDVKAILKEIDKDIAVKNNGVYQISIKDSDIKIEFIETDDTVETVIILLKDVKLNGHLCENLIESQSNCRFGRFIFHDNILAYCYTVMKENLDPNEIKKPFEEIINFILTIKDSVRALV